MEEQIIVQKDNILNIYENATIEQKLLLENVFGKDMFPQKDITEKVKTFKDAVAILGNDSLAVTNYNTIANEICTDDILAFAKLRVITEALNEGWKPNFNNGELSYYPSFHIYNNSEYEKLDDNEKRKCYTINNLDIVDNSTYVYVSYAASDSYCGKFSFKTKELAEYCGLQFIDIWFKFLFTNS